MELIHQGTTVLHHISTEAGEFPEVIEHRIREGKRFMVFQGEESCQRTSINTVTFSFLPLSLAELICSVGINLHHLVALSQEEVSQGNPIIPCRLNANKKVLFVWRKFSQCSRESLKSLAINIDREYSGIRILGKVADIYLVLMFANIYSYMVFSQFLTSFTKFLSSGSFPLCHHTRIESEVSAYRSHRITYQRSSSGSFIHQPEVPCPHVIRRSLPILNIMIHPTSIYVLYEIQLGGFHNHPLRGKL